MSQGYDYSELVETLIEAFESFSGRPLIESSTAGQQPDYPFAQYTITSPYKRITWDIVDGEIFEIVLSLTWRGLSGHEVLSLANKTNKYFRSQEGRIFMQENGVTVVDVLNSGLRDTFISIEYERMAGLDLRLRVRDSFVQEVQEIEEISIQNEGGI